MKNEVKPNDAKNNAHSSAICSDVPHRAFRTKVYFIEPTFFNENTPVDVFLCQGDVIDSNSSYRCGRNAAEVLGIREGKLIHEKALEQMFADSVFGPLFCTIYRAEDENGKGLSDWYDSETEAKRLADKLYGKVRCGELMKQKAMPLKFPVEAYIGRGEKGLSVKLNVNPDRDGLNASGCYLFPDRACPDLQEGPCEITSINMRGTYGFFKGSMKQFQMPSEEAIAEYVLNDSETMMYWSTSCTKLYFVEDSIFGSFTYIYPCHSNLTSKKFLIADHDGKCVESCFLQTMEGDNNSKEHNGLIRMEEKLHLSGTVRESVSVGDFLFQGFQNCSMQELKERFYSYKFEEKLRFRSEKDNTDHIPDELYELVKCGVVEAKYFNGIRYVVLDAYRLKSQMRDYISMPAGMMNEAIAQFNAINTEAEEKTRALLKKQKLGRELFA